MGIDPYSPITAICFTVLTLEAAAGIFMNLFILFVFVQQFCREKHIASGDAIQAAVIRSSIYLTLVLFSSMFCYTFYSEVFDTYTVLFHVLIIYSIGSSLYLTAIYCFFLFIKIVQLKSGILVWMKRNAALVLPRFAVAVEVFSVCCSFLSFSLFAGDGEVYTNSSTVSTSNVIKSRNPLQLVSFFILAVFLVPYFSMAVTTTLAACSLILHSHKMKISGTGNIEAYKKTVYKMMFFLISHTLFYVFLFLSYFLDLTDHVSGFWALVIIIFLLSPARSLILIYSNTKLRKAWKKMIGYIFCFKSFFRAEKPNVEENPK